MRVRVRLFLGLLVGALPAPLPLLPLRRSARTLRSGGGSLFPGALFLALPLRGGLGGNFLRLRLEYFRELPLEHR